MRTYSLEWFKGNKYLYGNANKVVKVAMESQDSLEANFLKAVTTLGEHFNEIAEKGVTYEVVFNFNGKNISVFGVQADCDGAPDFTYYFAADDVIMRSYDHDMESYEEIARASYEEFNALALV